MCSGGSSKMNTPGGISMSALMSSRMPPFAELYGAVVDQALVDVLESLVDVLETAEPQHPDGVTARDHRPAGQRARPRVAAQPESRRHQLVIRPLSG